MSPFVAGPLIPHAALAAQVDGGINASTITDAVAAGANVIVAGTFIFGSSDIADTILSMKAAFGK